MLYINKQNQVYSGDCLDNNRQLSEEEQALYLRGYGFKIIDGIITDISQTHEYIAEQEAKTKEAQRAELLAQIEELEKSQTRAIREVALGKSVDFAMGKLQTIDEQISELRSLL